MCFFTADTKRLDVEHPRDQIYVFCDLPTIELVERKHESDVSKAPIEIVYLVLKTNKRKRPERLLSRLKCQ